MFEFLENFEKRMEWIGITSSIINRKGKNTELEGLFEENELTSIIVSVLLFIMEKTLEENNECEMHHIEAFLGELTKAYYGKTFDRLQIKQIAGYIIKDILQNNGVRYTYPLINYTKQSFEEITIRLVTDKIIDENNERKIVYMLTNQGYEFLFRTREVDEEIQLTIEQLKLKEYIKRKKFSSAVRQSIELITYVRQKKKDIENFILSIRQNIHNVDVDEYESLIRSTFAMLTEEYETMAEIEKMIFMAEEKIKEEAVTGKDFEKRLEKAKGEIREIHHNIGVVITEQRDLIINRHSLTDMYMDTIRKSFEFSFEKRYDFEETVLLNLERYRNVLDSCLGLLKPLFLPFIDKSLSIGEIYRAQSILKETETQDAHMVQVEEYDSESEKQRLRRVSDRYVEVFELIVRMTLGPGKGEICLSRILEEIRDRDPDLYSRVTEERCIFLVALKLYDIGVIPISQFYNSQARVLLQPSEEFNVEYCLAVLKSRHEGLEMVKRLTIEKAEAEIRLSFEKVEAGLRMVENIEMTDLVFRVV